MTDGAGGSARLTGLAADSVSVALWTAVSRVSGFGRAAMIAAVLGPTYFGNTFQATNTIPSLTFEFLTGSLFASILVPSVVRALDHGDPRAPARVTNSFLGLVTVGFLLVTATCILAGPLLLMLLSTGVPDDATAREQQRVGMILLILLMPQVVLYGVAATGGAVQNAHGRFALAAAAPAAENVGIMGTMLAVGMFFPSRLDLATVPTSALVVLGLGTTGSVALHAGLQWFGAWRVGVTLVPRLGWGAPEFRELTRRLRPSLGYAGLNALRFFAVIVIANHVAGGVVAFTLALHFFYLPVAVCARPVAVALLPRLARLANAGDLAGFRAEAVRGTGLAFLLVIPAALALLVLAEPLATVVAYGEMASPQGRAAVAVSLTALALGVLGEAAFVVATHLSYALGDARSPLRAMLTRTVVSLVIMVAAAVWLDGQRLLAGLGLAITVGNAVGAWQLARSVRCRLPRTAERVLPPILRALGATVVMLIPAYVLATTGTMVVSGRVGETGGLIAAVVVGMGVFAGVLRAMHAPELTALSRHAPRERGASEHIPRAPAGELARLNVGPRRERAGAGRGGTGRLRWMTRWTRRACGRAAAGTTASRRRGSG